MVVRPTLLVGLGSFGIQAVADWMAYLQARNPEAMPFVDALGFVYPGVSVKNERMVRAYFTPGTHALGLNYDPWVYVVEPKEVAPAHRYRRLKQIRPLDMVQIVAMRHGRLQASQPPPDWVVRRRMSTPRIVIVGSIHDELVQHGFCMPATDDSATGLLPDLWEELIEKDGLTLEQRQVTCLLFIDPPPGQPEGQTRTLLQAIRDGATQTLGGEDEARGGLDLMLISARSRVNSNAPSTQLWDDAEPWSRDFCAAASGYASMLLQVITTPAGGDRLDRSIMDAGPTARHGLFSVPSLMMFDSSRTTVHQYAVAAVLAEQLDRVLQSGNGADKDALIRDAEGILEGVISGLKGLPDLTQDHRHQVQEPQPGTFPEAQSDATVARADILGSFQQAIVRLRKSAMSYLEEVRESMRRTRRLFESAPDTKLRFDNALKHTCAELDHALTESLRECLRKQGLRSAAMAAEAVHELASVAAGGKPRLQDRPCPARYRPTLDSSFDWPPTVPEDMDLTDIEKLVHGIEAAKAINKTALAFYAAISALLAALGAFMLTTVFFAPGLAGLLWGLGAALAAALMPLLVAGCFILQTHRLIRRTEASLADKQTRIKGVAARRLVDLGERFARSYKGLYTVRAYRHLARRAGRLALRLRRATEQLEQRRAMLVEEAEALRNSRPRSYLFSYVDHNQDEFHNNCTRTAACLRRKRGEATPFGVDLLLHQDADADSLIAMEEYELNRLARDAADEGIVINEQRMQRAVAARTPLLDHPAALYACDPADTPGSKPYPGRDAPYFALRAPHAMNAILSTVTEDFEQRGCSLMVHETLIQRERLLLGRFYWHTDLSDLLLGDA